MTDISDCETFEDAIIRVRGSMEGRDIIDELVDVQDLMSELCKAGRADKLGEVVLAVFDAYVERVAANRYYGQPMNNKSAQEAAAAVMAK